jgi:hypothetical protein
MITHKCAKAVLSVLIHLVASGVALSQPRLTGGTTPYPPGTAVSFVNVRDGATFSTKATIPFGLRGMLVAPGSDLQNSGHHHLLIDTELPPLDQQSPTADSGQIDT